jgi:hypothetical protein
VNWGHLIWAVVVGGLLTSAVVVMGTFGLVARPLSDFAVLLYLRLALLSGASYMVFNRVSFRQRRVEVRRQSEPDRDLARSAATSTEGDRSLLHQRHVGSHPRQTQDLEEPSRHDHLSKGHQAAPTRSHRVGRRIVDSICPDARKGRHRVQPRLFRSDDLQDLHSPCSQGVGDQ